MRPNRSSFLESGSKTKADCEEFQNTFPKWSVGNPVANAVKCPFEHIQKINDKYINGIRGIDGKEGNQSNQGAWSTFTTSAGYNIQNFLGQFIKLCMKNCEEAGIGHPQGWRKWLHKRKTYVEHLYLSVHFTDATFIPTPKRVFHISSSSIFPF